MDRFFNNVTGYKKIWPSYSLPSKTSGAEYLVILGLQSVGQIEHYSAGASIRNSIDCKYLHDLFHLKA